MILGTRRTMALGMLLVLLVSALMACGPAGSSGGPARGAATAPAGATAGPSSGTNAIEPPGVNGWTDSSNNEAYLAGKLATTLNGASLYYAMTTSKDQKVRDTIAKNTILLPWPAGPKGAFTLSNPNNWIIFDHQDQQKADLAKDLIRQKYMVAGLTAGSVKG